MNDAATRQQPRGSQRADYGLDAPPVVRNLAIVAAAGVLTTTAWLMGLWSMRSALAFVFCPLMSLGAGCLFMTVWMVWYSNVGKLRARVRLLDLVLKQACPPRDLAART